MILPVHNLTAITPLDGRYANKTKDLQHFFSEFALIKYRVYVEVEYLIYLDILFGWKTVNQEKLRQRVQNFSVEDGEAIKEIERTTNHDVKAVEYWIKELLRAEQYDAKTIEHVHFGLTSQDINNTAMPLMVRDAEQQVMLPVLEATVAALKDIAQSTMDQAMLALTHGQPASPTTLGKELLVFVDRLSHCIDDVKQLGHSGKFGGATGNFNAHTVAYPSIHWAEEANAFYGILGLQRQQVTTQIEHYDGLAARLDAWKRCAVILVDLCRDIWSYISLNVFTQKVVKGEVGSSAMPHKVNPIGFENAEGNLLFAMSHCTFFGQKLPISRLQRDLTDSTVTRNLGLPFGHILIALHSLQKGLGKLKVNTEAIHATLEKNWAVLAEAIQTILRREGVENPYEMLKALTRTGEGINQQTIKNFIEELDVSNSVKDELRKLSPQNYLGDAANAFDRLED